MTAFDVARAIHAIVRCEQREHTHAVMLYFAHAWFARGFSEEIAVELRTRLSAQKCKLQNQTVFRNPQQ